MNSRTYRIDSAECRLDVYVFLADVVVDIVLPPTMIIQPSIPPDPLFNFRNLAKTTKISIFIFCSIQAKSW